MGVPTEGIAVHVEAHSIALMFRSRSFPNGYGAMIAQGISITWTPCAFGGRRPWFRCEAYRNSRYCGRRAAILYSAGGVFACRHCHDLRYESQNETPRLRDIRRVRKIRMRLGAGFSFAEPFPDKPPGMHCRSPSDPSGTLHNCWRRRRPPSRLVLPQPAPFRRSKHR
jgi:hypothetical protein